MEDKNKLNWDIIQGNFKDFIPHLTYRMSLWILKNIYNFLTELFEFPTHELLLLLVLNIDNKIMVRRLLVALS